MYKNKSFIIYVQLSTILIITQIDKKKQGMDFFFFFLVIIILIIKLLKNAGKKKISF